MVKDVLGKKRTLRELMKKFILITTIHSKSQGISRFEQMDDWHVILVADRKSVPIESSRNLTFLSVEDQNDLGYKMVEACPFDHYARKNIGYIYAIKNGAEIIYDTDDDNLPYDDWHTQEFVCSNQYHSENKFVNIYRYFTDQTVWPRGYPLDEISRKEHAVVTESNPLDVGIWQGLVDLEPDVDAIFRLTINKEIKFKKKPSVVLEKGHYCPVNSQNTLWNKKIFPYLYLPTTVSMRFTDILRGYISQCLMWQHDLHLGISKPTLYQVRNHHDFMKDFNDEISCYTDTKSIIQLLDLLIQTSKSLVTLERVYQILSEKGFVSPEEMKICEAWLTDLNV